MEIKDPVNHPPHYLFSKIEVIDALEAWELNYHRACIVKYTVRAGRKNPETEIQDLEKAEWYLQREIQRLKRHAK